MPEIEQDPHALAIIAVLEAEGLTVGDGAAKKSGTTIITPQVVLHMIPGGTVDGTLGDPDEWADARFQVTAVGQIARQARWAADQASTALANRTVTVEGRAVMRVRPTEPWGATDIDHDVTPNLHYATRKYGFFTFPS